MIADLATHDSIFIAALSAVGLIIVATIPLLWSNRRTGKAVEQNMTAMADHLPPNGMRLYQMVEATHATVTEMQMQMAKFEAEGLERQVRLERVERLLGDIRAEQNTIERRRMAGGTQRRASDRKGGA